jgi:hypothetical protein
MPFFSRRRVHVLLGVLGLFLLGTVVVLSSISYYLAIPDISYIYPDELDVPYEVNSNVTNLPSSAERIPRILHQTWKSETLPDRWQDVSDGCRELMPD